MIDGIDEVQVESSAPLSAGRIAWLQIGLALALIVGGCVLLLSDVPPVALSWETASEVGTAGFNVYRAGAEGEAFVQVNDALIPARGDEVTGATYRFADDDVQPGRRYVYRIEEVEWDGTVNAYPETVTVRAGLPRLWTRVEGVLLIFLAAVLLWRGWRR